MGMILMMKSPQNRARSDSDRLSSSSGRGSRKMTYSPTPLTVPWGLTTSGGLTERAKWPAISARLLRVSWDEAWFHCGGLDLYRPEVLENSRRAEFTCPECGLPLPIYDHVASRRWRYLAQRGFGRVEECGGRNPGRPPTGFSSTGAVSIMVSDTRASCFPRSVVICGM